jgi:hypothetical protein
LNSLIIRLGIGVSYIPKQMLVNGYERLRMNIISFGAVIEFYFAVVAKGPLQQGIHRFGSTSRHVVEALLATSNFLQTKILMRLSSPDIRWCRRCIFYIARGFINRYKAGRYFQKQCSRSNRIAKHERAQTESWLFMLKLILSVTQVRPLNRTIIRDNGYMLFSQFEFLNIFLKPEEQC